MGHKNLSDLPPWAQVVVFGRFRHWIQVNAPIYTSAEAKLSANIGSPKAVSLAGVWLRNVLAPARKDQPRS